MRTTITEWLAMEDTSVSRPTAHIISDGHGYGLLVHGGER